MKRDQFKKASSWTLRGAVVGCAAVAVWAIAQTSIPAPSSPASMPAAAASATVAGSPATGGQAIGQPPPKDSRTSAAMAPTNAAPGKPGVPEDPQVARGRYLATAGDCISCHTRPGGAPFAGGLPMKTPFGTIISTNVTPDAQNGIGGYSEAEFVKAVREGIAKDGHHLYPAMPYPSFARVSDEDMSALYAFMMKGVKPSAQTNPATDLPWPFSMRWLMIGWNMLYLDNKRFEPQTQRSAEWNRGAYLVTGLGHCGDCHTPRSFTGGVKASTERGGKEFLSGGDAEGWHAQGLHPGDSASPNSAAVWPLEDLVRYLQTGRNDRTAAFGPMSQVVENSTQYLNAQDLIAMSTYIKSLGTTEGQAAPAAQTPLRYAPAPGTLATGLPPGVAQPASAPAVPSAQLLQSGDATRNRGAMVFLNNCNACHRSDGTGAAAVFPALAGNSVVNAKNPASLIRIVLGGSAMASTEKSPSALAMPDFGWRLSDGDVADVLTFIRGNWGNQAAAVDAETVAKARASMEPKQAKR